VGCRGEVLEAETRFEDDPGRKAIGIQFNNLLFAGTPKKMVTSGRPPRDMAAVASILGRPQFPLEFEKIAAMIDQSDQGNPFAGNRNPREFEGDQAFTSFEHEIEMTAADPAVRDRRWRREGMPKDDKSLTNRGLFVACSTRFHP
jgi:hypothetical protein